MQICHNNHEAPSDHELREWARIYIQPLPSDEFDDAQPDPRNAVIQCLITEVYMLREQIAKEGPTYEQKVRVQKRKTYKKNIFLREAGGRMNSYAELRKMWG